MSAPPKYIKINGISKLNPAYTASQGQKPTASPAALPVVSTMDDYSAFNESNLVSGRREVPLSDSTESTLEIMQQEDITRKVGVATDEMVDGMQKIFAKYEVPMGLMNKLMELGEFDILDFMIDDSGSMTLTTDALTDGGQRMTRWDEAFTRMKEIVEVLSYVPVQTIRIKFLNRRDIISVTRTGETPLEFKNNLDRQLDSMKSRSPNGTTPVLACLQESMTNGRGKRVARYFFGDGEPNSGEKGKIIDLVCYRQNPESNPITFMSCTNDDSQVLWMKDLEERGPYVAELDDFSDEKAEVLGDQGEALPYTRGFHIICQLVAAINPEDLDAMDESIPFTKYSLDNLLGVVSSNEDYDHYFKCFCSAQKTRKIEDGKDNFKRNWDWSAYKAEFYNAKSQKDIRRIDEFKSQLQSVRV